MRPFRFRLEGLLRIRKIHEDRCRQELGEFRSAVAEIDKHIQEIAREDACEIIHCQAEGAKSIQGAKEWRA